MAKKKKTATKAVWGWVLETPKPTITPTFKATVEATFQPLLEALKIQHIKPENTENDELYDKYPTDVYLKWHKHFVYVCLTYRHTHPQAISPHYESRIVRIECHNTTSFTLSYFRHTGQWTTLYYNEINAQEAEKAILEDSFFEVFMSLKH